MAGSKRKQAEYLDRLAKGLIHKKEPKYGEDNKGTVLAKIKEVCGQEYVEQLKEGKHYTARDLFNSINQQNMSIYRRMGITDIEILAKIQEGIDEKEKSGVLKGKFDRVLKAGLFGSSKLIPQSAENKMKDKILKDLKGSVEKKYVNAKLDGKTLTVDELYSLQKESWVKKSNTDMLQMYSKVGITENEIKIVIGKVIDEYK
jgi:hypothetical protein